MPKILTMRLDDETYAVFLKAAKVERRSLCNFVETAALRHLEEAGLVDDLELAEMLSRPQLVKRLKAGSADAKKRRGRFVYDIVKKAVDRRHRHMHNRACE
ncbi:MAG: CopG family transcriptional regulator [Acidobacteria bacterium]|nr:CopG family transcriptional regulator [Acidobacteriota bacterium]